MNQRMMPIFLLLWLGAMHAGCERSSPLMSQEEINRTGMMQVVLAPEQTPPSTDLGHIKFDRKTNQVKVDYTVYPLVLEARRPRGSGAKMATRAEKILYAVESIEFRFLLGEQVLVLEPRQTYHNVSSSQFSQLGERLKGPGPHSYQSVKSKAGISGPGVHARPKSKQEKPLEDIDPKVLAALAERCDTSIKMELRFTTVLNDIQESLQNRDPKIEFAGLKQRQYLITKNVPIACDKTPPMSYKREQEGIIPGS